MPDHIYPFCPCDLDIVHTHCTSFSMQMFILILLHFWFAHTKCPPVALPHPDNVNRFNGNEPRWNFIDIFHSFMVVIRSLCGEWVESLYDCLLVSGAWSIVYFSAMALIGSFVVSYNFLAIFPLFHSHSAIMCSILLLNSFALVLVFLLLLSSLLLLLL